MVSVLKPQFLQNFPRQRVNLQEGIPKRRSKFEIIFFFKREAFSFKLFSLAFPKFFLVLLFFDVININVALKQIYQTLATLRMPNLLHRKVRQKIVFLF